MGVPQVSDNVLNHQFTEYVKSQGIDPYHLTPEQEAELKQDMNSDYYPGSSSALQSPHRKYPKIDFITGLDKVPSVLVDTMLPNVNPETAAKKSVIINGGYDPCQYNVSV